MTAPQVHVLVFDGFADWEPSYALAELRRSAHQEVVAVGFGPRPVTSMGGLRVTPDRTLGAVRVPRSHGPPLASRHACT